MKGGAFAGSFVGRSYRGLADLTYHEFLSFWRRKKREEERGEGSDTTLAVIHTLTFRPRRDLRLGFSCHDMPCHAMPCLELKCAISFLPLEGSRAIGVSWLGWSLCRCYLATLLRCCVAALASCGCLVGDGDLFDVLVCIYWSIYLLIDW